MVASSGTMLSRRRSMFRVLRSRRDTVASCSRIKETSYEPFNKNHKTVSHLTSSAI